MRGCPKNARKTCLSIFFQWRNPQKIRRIPCLILLSVYMLYKKRTRRPQKSLRGSGGARQILSSSSSSEVGSGSQVWWTFFPLSRPRRSRRKKRYAASFCFVVFGLEFLHVRAKETSLSWHCFTRDSIFGIYVEWYLISGNAFFTSDIVELASPTISGEQQCSAKKPKTVHLPPVSQLQVYCWVLVWKIAAITATPTHSFSSLEKMTRRGSKEKRDPDDDDE